MMELKIKDNTYTDKSEFEHIKNITKRISDKTIEQLEREGVFVFPKSIKNSEDIKKDNIILQSINNNYRSSNIVGFLGSGNEGLVIESRFSIGEQDYFFQYLLERVLNIPNIVEFNTQANRESQIFNLLLFLFPYYLKNSMRKGVFKTYINNKYNDSNVKGSVDIARHIRKNIPFTGKIAYNQRGFSYDNYLMEIIRHTIEFIKTKAYGRQLLESVKEEVALVVESTDNYEYYDRNKIIITNKKNPIRHAYYYEYRILQRLCIMILQHEKQQISSGMLQIHGILFDGAWLWEGYVNILISDLFYHPMNKMGKGAQRLFSKNIGLIYPDFISRDRENRIIADAKYKPIENIGNRDYLQVLAYMFRFDAKKGFYIYPEKGEPKDMELRMNSGTTYENDVTSRNDIFVMKCGLNIPRAANNYEDFKVKIKKNEIEFKKFFISKS